MKSTTSSTQFDFNTLYQELALPVFERLEQLDQRRSNSSYLITDVCKSAFAIYSLKVASLLEFRPKTEVEKENLKQLFQIKNIPSDNGMRKILDKVDSSQLRTVFNDVSRYLQEHGVFEQYQYLENYNVISIDGVEHYCSKQVNCPCCLERKHRDGSTSYYHSMLSAALVCPKKQAVFVLDNEPIIRQDGDAKNDCERNAAKRLFANLSVVHGSKSIVYVLDALYGCAPIINLIEGSSPQWRYIINCKETGNKHLFKQFDQANEQGKVRWKNYRRKDGTYEVGYINQLELNASNKSVKTNMVIVNFRNKKGEVKTFSYITNLEVNDSTAMKTIEMGRSRWKIENEVFNTLKNQQYNFEHSFGHGKENLATNFAYLMMLAFTIDQIRQFNSRLFRSIWKGLNSKIATWDAIRTVFKMVPCESVDDLCHKILTIYQLKMIRR